MYVKRCLTSSIFKMYKARRADITIEKKSGNNQNPIRGDMSPLVAVSKSNIIYSYSNGMLTGLYIK